MNVPGAPNFAMNQQSYGGQQQGNTYQQGNFYGQQPSPAVDYSQNSSAMPSQVGMGMSQAPQQAAVPTGAYSYTAGNSGNQATINQFGLRDKYDQGGGLMQVNPLETQFNVLEQTLIVDTRDCIGDQSLVDARTSFVAQGGRGPIFGDVTNATNTNPIVITFSSVDDLRDGDMLTFQSIRGCTNANGIHKISNINTVFLTAEITAGGNGAYIGGGVWSRAADSGYPEIKDTDSTISGNVITVKLSKELKQLRTITLYHIVVPRDIIPLTIYLSDFITAGTDENNANYGVTSTDYTTWIPQERKYMESRMLGFYSTPLDMWRTYTFGAFPMQDQVTPPPMQLWNPPLGPWPTGQPTPYPFQTVPTYRSNSYNITIPNPVAGSFYLILAGHGVYDLVDWTIITGAPATDAFNTDLIRKLLLFLICPKQSLNDVDYVDLILNCTTVDTSPPLNLDITSAYGFGDFQRYVPGPGVGQTYQPGTGASIGGAVYTNGGGGVSQPNVPGAANGITLASDSPIPFPDFLGNVWGPYNKPGDRFQKLGLRTVVQDLYLNGDLNNLLGSPVIVPNVPTEGIVTDPSFGLNFSALIEVTLDNVSGSTNPNIANAMRIVPNGFGAASIRANGGGLTYTNQYNATAGGQGPSNLGTPSAWVNTGIYGAASFSDPIAQGAAGPNPTAVTSDASNIGTGVLPSHETSYYDLGQNNGSFQFNITNYVGYVVNDIPDTDLIIRVEEARRSERSQSTRPPNGDAILDCPIRLNLGTTSGNLQYIEALQSLLAGATGYWEKRYLNPKARLDKLHISFWAYEGQPIPLERMLQVRRSLEALRLFVRINDSLDLVNDPLVDDPFGVFSFLFDPTNPQLIGRMKRYFQIIFKANTYQGTPPGLEPTAFTSIGPGAAIPSDIRNFS